jgi:hypothetical protein
MINDRGVIASEDLRINVIRVNYLWGDDRIVRNDGSPVSGGKVNRKNWNTFRHWTLG